jgi:SAM-dependent methyltransferase
MEYGAVNGSESVPFGAYAAAYDALYADKDYRAECDFVGTLWAKHGRGPLGRVLDLGCGTGGHAAVLAPRGVAVVGVDRAPAMLRQARTKVPGATFVEGDARAVRLERRDFDAVLAMFAVVAYQTSPEDQRALYRTAREHLAPGGLFVFDGWFGPAVLRDPPTERTKTAGPIKRRTRVRWHRERQVVDVEFTVQDGRHEFTEVHPMRYQFPDEIRDGLAAEGLGLVELCPFLKPGASCTDRDWLFTAVARRGRITG